MKHERINKLDNTGLVIIRATHREGLPTRRALLPDQKAAADARKLSPVWRGTLDRSRPGSSASPAHSCLQPQSIQHIVRQVSQSTPGSATTEQGCLRQ